MTLTTGLWRGGLHDTYSRHTRPQIITTLFIQVSVPSSLFISS